MMGYIYVLLDPATNEVRYVGQTSGTLRHRFTMHLYGARHGEKTRKAKWIRSLLRNNTHPIMKTIERVDSDKLDEREQYWIEHYKSIGARLVNLSVGGAAHKMYSGPGFEYLKLVASLMGINVPAARRYLREEIAEGRQKAEDWEGAI